MFKVILLAALISAVWTEGYPKVKYESDIDGDTGLIDEDDLRPQYRRQPIYQTQVEYNDEDEQDDIPLIKYDQKSPDSYHNKPSASAGYHRPGKQGTYKGSDISHEIKHKKESYENTKVSQEHLEVKSVGNEYGARLPSYGKKEPSEAYKPSAQEEYKSPSDEKDYSGHIGQANKAPEYKPTYSPSKKAQDPVKVQQDNVEVDFKSQSPSSYAGGVKSAYKPPIQPGLATGMRPGYYGNQGETYGGYSMYDTKKPYENRQPVQTYGVYREGPRTHQPAPSGGASYHSNLGGSGVEYPGIRSAGSVPPSPSVSSYRPQQTSSYRPPSPPVSSYRPPQASSYRPPSPPVSSYRPTQASSYRPPSPPASSYRPSSSPVSYRPPSAYSPNNQGYAPANIGTSYHQSIRGSGHNSGSNRNYNQGGNHNGYSRPQAPTYPKAPEYPKPYQPHSVKSPSIKTAISSGVKTSGYPASQSGILSAGRAPVKTASSSGSYHPQPNYPPTKIHQEKHVDDQSSIKGGYHHPKPSYPSTKTSQHSDGYPSVQGGNHHSKANYPQPKPIAQDKEEYPSFAEAKPQASGIGESGYIGKGEPKYPAASGVKGGSYEPKEYSGVKSGYSSGSSPSLSSGYKAPTASGVKGGSYKPKEYSAVKSGYSSGSSPSLSSGYKAPTASGVKGGSYEPKEYSSVKSGYSSGSSPSLSSGYKAPAASGVKGGSYEPKEYSAVKSGYSSGSSPSLSSGYKAPTASGVKGGSYEPKEYSAVKSGYSSGSSPSLSSGYKAPTASEVKGGSYEPKEYSAVKSGYSSESSPSLSSGYKAPTAATGHSIKGGPSEASYQDKKSPSKYLPITAVSGGYSAPSYKPVESSYKPVESSHKYEPAKVEQAELSYESLLGGHGSQSSGTGSGGYGFSASGSPNSASSGSGYGSHEEHSKPMPYEFKYEVKDHEHGSDHYREEKMDDNGYLTGRYGYMDPHGLYRMVEYQASKDGFKVNHVKTNEPGTDNQDPADVHFEVEKQY